tara:strand:- start:17 stop:343 length:327 start_codon:yes stop_codon:yes gene_type:complete
MPTVSYKCPDSGKNKKRKFAYNAVGKAQADSYARLTGGKLKMNPGPNEEESTKTTVLKKSKINFDTTPEKTKEKEKKPAGKSVKDQLASAAKLIEEWKKKKKEKEENV